MRPRMRPRMRVIVLFTMSVCATAFLWLRPGVRGLTENRASSRLMEHYERLYRYKCVLSPRYNRSLRSKLVH